MHTPPAFLGIEIGGTKLQLCVSDTAGQLKQSIRLAVDPAGRAEDIRQQIAAGILKLNGREAIAAVGVGFGGPVDWQKGLIRVSHQVAGWSGFPLGSWLHQLTGKPVAVENDANAAALAEALHGSGKGYERVFYMTIGSGIGGGMVINGKIYHGRAPGEAEVGHLRLNKRGDTLEFRCSGWAVDKKVAEYIARQPHSLLARLALDRKAPGATLLQPALQEGDADAQKLVEEITDDLAFALSHVVHLLHPDVLIIGGGLSLLQEHLRRPLTEKIPHYLMQAFLPPPPVYMASLQELVVPIGAQELAKQLINP